MAAQEDWLAAVCQDMMLGYVLASGLGLRGKIPGTQEFVNGS